MLCQLKKKVCEANLELVRAGLVIQTWGNASGIDRERGIVVIKASGVPYEAMEAKHMVPVCLKSGAVLDGSFKPSSDTATHLELYRAFPTIGGVVHTHSLYATAWAQACLPLPALGTTQADYWHGPVPCTRLMSAAEIGGDYEANTGKVIVETFKHLDPLHCPAVFVASHGPFTWGPDVHAAVRAAEVLEFVARLGTETLRINPAVGSMQPQLLDKHFLRKHGPGTYYGQAHPSTAT